MNDFQKLVADLRQMARDDEAAPLLNPPRTRHDELAEQLVRQQALQAPDDKRLTWSDSSPQLLAAIDRARDRLHDEVITIQRKEYLKARRVADRIDAQNLREPGANYTYPTWVTNAFARFSHHMPEGQKE